jgi:hypothetical protein
VRLCPGSAAAIEFAAELKTYLRCQDAIYFARISACGGGWTGGVSDGLFGVTSGTFSGLMTEQLVTDRYGHLFKSDDHKAAMDAIAENFIISGG